MICSNINVKNKNIVSAEAYLSKQSFIREIITWCNLHPCDSWREWRDGLGNLVTITELRTLTFKHVDIPELSPNDILYKPH